MSLNQKIESPVVLIELGNIKIYYRRFWSDWSEILINGRTIKTKDNIRKIIKDLPIYIIESCSDQKEIRELLEDLRNFIYEHLLEDELFELFADKLFDRVVSL